VVIVPIYDENGSNYFVKVNYYYDDQIIRKWSGPDEAYKLGDFCGKKAETPFTYNDNVYYFHYWKIGDTIVSYNKSVDLRRMTSQEVELKAYYSDTEIALTGDSANYVCLGKPMPTGEHYTVSGKYVASFRSEYALPEGYQICEMGILYTTKSDVGGDAELFKLNKSGVYKYTSAKTSANGAKLFGDVTLNLKSSSPKGVVYARMYMLYTSSGDSTVKTVYSGVDWYDLADLNK
ncbi:MAG: hypothetical protein KBS79_04670, partial [Lachnospiraceae bacterium]|nr:hypothetical protein [Candidatus Minthocola equi]